MYKVVFLSDAERSFKQLDTTIQKRIAAINLAIKYPNSVIPAWPESFFEFILLRRPIPDKRG